MNLNPVRDYYLALHILVVMAGGGKERKGDAGGASQGGFRIGAVTPVIS